MRLGLLAASLAVLAAPAAAHAATLVVRVEGIEDREGTVKVAVCTSGFDEQGCPMGASRAPRGTVEEFVFEGVTPGRHAIAVYHDRNGNERLDTVPPGLPTEPYGFSNGVGRLRPPDFEAARVEVGEGRTVVTVRLRRLLG